MESGADESDVTERVIPTESVKLMFHYKNPFVVLGPDGSTLKQPRSILSGLSNSFSDVSTSGESRVVFVTFYPHGACHFFDFPLSEIENKSVDLAGVFSYLGKTTKQIIKLIRFQEVISGLSTRNSLNLTEYA